MRRRLNLFGPNSIRSSLLFTSEPLLTSGYIELFESLRTVGCPVLYPQALSDALESESTEMLDPILRLTGTTLAVDHVWKASKGTSPTILQHLTSLVPEPFFDYQAIFEHALSSQVISVMTWAAKRSKEVERPIDLSKQRLVQHGLWSSEPAAAVWLLEHATGIGSLRAELDEYLSTSLPHGLAIANRLHRLGKIATEEIIPELLALGILVPVAQLVRQGKFPTGPDSTLIAKKLVGYGSLPVGKLDREQKRCLAKGVFFLLLHRLIIEETLREMLVANLGKVYADRIMEFQEPP